MKKINNIFPALLIIAAATLWGIDGSVLRPALYHLSVPCVVFAEHFIVFTILFASLIFLCLTTKPKFLKNDIKQIKNLKPKDWFSVFWISFFGGMIGTLAITKALFYVHFVPLSIPILLQKLQPLFGIVFALIVLKEKPKKKFYLWFIIAVIGSYLITFGFNKPIISIDNKTFVAAVLGLIAAFSWGTSTVFGKKALKKLSYRSATFLRFGLTSLMILILITFTKSFKEFTKFYINHFLVLIIIAFTSGGLAIFIYYKGLKKIKASKTVIYELAFPITVIVLDYLLHDKILSIPQFIGGGLILLSMIKITK
jgi:drug/metabolite transporter (DMT)-like permease